jgi:hypothetical protein
VGAVEQSVRTQNDDDEAQSQSSGVAEQTVSRVSGLSVLANVEGMWEEVQKNGGFRKKLGGV